MLDQCSLSIIPLERLHAFRLGLGLRAEMLFGYISRPRLGDLVVRRGGDISLLSPDRLVVTSSVREPLAVSIVQVEGWLFFAWCVCRWKKMSTNKSKGKLVGGVFERYIHEKLMFCRSWVSSLADHHISSTSFEENRRPTTTK